MKITQREAECLIRHMDSQRMQHLEEREADFCEACCQCSHVQECKSDTWLENTHNLSKIAGVFINPALLERNHTQDNLKEESVPVEKQTLEIKLSVTINISDGYSYDIICKNVKEFIADIAASRFLRQHLLEDNR